MKLQVSDRPGAIHIVESGEFTTMLELGEHVWTASSYRTRVLRLAMLAPDIVDAILVGAQVSVVPLWRLHEPFLVI